MLHLPLNPSLNFGNVWPGDDTVIAFETILRRNKWFPTLSEVLESRPRVEMTVDDWDEVAGFNWIKQEQPQPTTQEREQQIDNLTDEQL